MKECYNQDCIMISDSWAPNICWHDDEDYHWECPKRIREKPVEDDGCEDGVSSECNTLLASGGVKGEGRPQNAGV